MKKFFLFAISLSCLAMTSCMKKAGPDPMLGGIYLYNTANAYYYTAMDFTSMAINLNTLLTEAKGNYSNLNTIMSPDGKLNYKNELFSTDATVTYNTTTGDVLIAFAASVQTRNGNIIFKTGNKLLNASDAAWTVVNDTSTKFTALMYTDSFNYSVCEITIGNYSIIQNVGQWMVSATGIKCKPVNSSSAAPSNWELYTSVIPSDMLDTSFIAMSTKPLTIATGASAAGTPVGSNWKYSYNITQALVYKPICSTYMPTSGVITVQSLDAYAADPVTYPAYSVKLIYYPGAADCSIIRVMEYNGYSQQR